ncbi:MAG TPA: hypothetical protein VIH99_05160 [Bdellovibrionota bacterium]|jgi:hypothetical protein
MGRASKTFFFLFLCFFLSDARAFDFPASDESLRDCYQSQIDSSALTQLNWVARNITPWLTSMASIPDLVESQGSPQKTLTRNRPDLWLLGRTAVCYSIRISFAICGKEELLESENTEIDTFRHFILATKLFSARGFETAQMILAAHEKKPSDWQENDLMDARNNSLALAWAQAETTAGRTINYRSASAAAFKLMKEGKLEVMTPLPKEKCNWRQWEDKDFPRLEKLSWQMPPLYNKTLKKVCGYSE